MVKKKYYLVILALIISGFFLVEKTEATTDESELADLDVTFISRTPRYEKYHTERGLNGQYRLKTGTEFWQRWPEEEEMVTFTAQITNQGNVISGEFGFKWYVDGVEVSSGTISNLNPGSYTTQDYLWRWVDGTHTIKFQVDPEGTIEEISEQNNLLTEKTNTLSLIFHVEEGFCSAFDYQKNSAGSYSCEDWLQQQVSAFNEILNQALTGATGSTTSSGANLRVRIDNIYIHANGEIDSSTGSEDWLYDGSWNIAWDYDDNDCLDRGIWCADPDYVNAYAKTTDWNLLRNLAINTLGLVDLSKLSIYTSDVHITDEDGATVGGGLGMLEVETDYVYKNRHSGLLNSINEQYFSEYSILALIRFNNYYTDISGDRRGLPKRRGIPGEYLKDIPAQNKIKVLDKNGDPLPQAGIAIFQESAYGFEDMIKYSGGTNSSGLWTIPSETASTYWGMFMETRNPFSYADLHDHSQGIVAGHTAIPYPTDRMFDTGLVVRLAAAGQMEYHFLDITDFNQAYWLGNQDSATYTLQTDFEPFQVTNQIITGTKQGGGPQVRILDQYGNLVSQFMAFEESFRGGVKVAKADVDGDGNQEIITASGPGRRGEIRIFNTQGTLEKVVLAFDSNFQGGLALATGDLDGSGLAEIVVAPLSGGGPNIRIFGYRNGQYLPTTENFMAYDSGFRGGVNLAVGDLEGDGLSEIITAPKSQGGPHLRIFGYRNGVYRPVILGLMAYEESFRGGINLACGDLNSDGADEIITGVVSAGGPHIRVFGRNRQSTISLLNPGFMAFDSSFQGGVNVASADLDSDGQAEIVTAIESGDVAKVRVYNWRGTLLLNEFIAYPKGYLNGVNL
ncbi:MAG: CARDB domain-containing protein [Patescibacteria group bacterium]